MYFVSSKFDLYSAPVSAVMYIISCYIGPSYNSTRLYYHISQGLLSSQYSVQGRHLTGGFPAQSTAQAIEFPIHSANQAIIGSENGFLPVC